MDEKIREIKEHLKEVVPEDVYEKWISGFVFESIDKEFKSRGDVSRAF